MSRWMRVLKIEQPQEEDLPRLRSWLIAINLLLAFFSLLFTGLWAYLAAEGRDVPSVSVSLTAVLAYLLFLGLAWRNKTWQSALLLALYFNFSATFAFWNLMNLEALVVALYTVNLIFVSIFLGQWWVHIFAGVSVVSFVLLNFFGAHGSAELLMQPWEFTAEQVVMLSVFVLAYLIILMNIEGNRIQSAGVVRSQARYKMLFESSPTALWEEDASEIFARVHQLQRQGVTDFKAYFQAHPETMLEMMSLLKVVDVNETAVSMYKATDKSQLMNNLDKLVPEQSYPFVIDSLAAMAEGETTFQREVDSLTLDGNVISTLYRWSVPDECAETYSRVIISITDITQQKQAEHTLQRYSDRFSSLHEMDVEISLKKSPEDIAQVALAYVRRHVACWGADAWMYDLEARQMWLLAMETDEGGNGRVFPANTSFPFVSEEMLEIQRNNQPFLLEDLWELRFLPPPLAELKAFGIRSYLQVPLLVRGQLIGSFNLSDKEPGAFTPEHIGIARDIAVPLAIALSNVQLLVAESEARMQAETLRQVATNLNKNLELEPLLGHILDQLALVIPYDGAIIYLAEDESLNVVSHRGISEVALQEVAAAAERLPIIDDVYRRGIPRIVADSRKEPDWVIVPGGESVRCWMGIPLMAQDHVIGLLALDKSIARFYSQKDLALAVAFANQASVAMENARLFHDERKYAAEMESRVQERTRDLTTLYEIAAVAGTFLNLDEILEKSLDILSTALSCFIVTVHVTDEDGNMCLRYVKGVSPEWMETISFYEAGYPLAEQIIREPNPVYIHDLAETPYLQGMSLPLHTFSYAGMAMRVRGTVVGILSLVNRAGRQFTADDLALLSSVADHIGVAIENARLREKTQQVAVLQERERLARELHDSVTQSLYSLTLFAEASRDLLENGRSQKLREYLDDISVTAQQALKEMRLMLYELRTEALVEEGLVKALQYRLEAVEGRSGMETHIEAEPGLNIPPELEEALYRVTQEALNNTLKHAKATAVFITLAQRQNNLMMTIEDDGRGFSPQLATVQSGMGLRTMRERIEEAGGVLVINSLPEIGTRIEITVNLRPEQQQAVRTEK